MAVVSNETGDVKTEVVSPRIQIEWDSAKQQGQIIFATSRLVSLNGEVMAQQDLNHLMIVPVAELLPRSFDVVIGQDEAGKDIVHSVPTMLVMGYIKAAFDTLYEEKIVNYVPDPMPTGVVEGPVPDPTNV